MARLTTKYTVDTEHDYYTHQPALIQIEFILPQSLILVIEVCHLPDASTQEFTFIQSLLEVVFDPAHVIYSWGDAIHELSRFTTYGLCSWSTLGRMTTVDVQRAFKT